MVECGGVPDELPLLGSMAGLPGAGEGDAEVPGAHVRVQRSDPTLPRWPPSGCQSRRQCACRERLCLKVGKSARLWVRRATA